MSKKICSRCHEKKDLADYYKVSGGRDRYRSECKACYKVAQKAAYLKDREKRLVYAKRWKEANPDRARATRLRFDARNPGYAKAYNAWYSAKRKAEAKGSKEVMPWVWKNGRQVKKSKKTI